MKLHRENEQLREKLRKTRTISITGTGGEPIYCQAQLSNREPERPDGISNRWRVTLHSVLRLCPLADLPHIEIRIGGITKAQSPDESKVDGGFWDFQMGP